MPVAAEHQSSDHSHNRTPVSRQLMQQDASLDRMPIVVRQNTSRDRTLVMTQNHVSEDIVLQLLLHDCTSPQRGCAVS